MAARATIRLLDETLAEQLSDQLALLDRDLRELFGSGYSDEEWTARNFLAPRPSKWRFSHVALADDDDVAGFWIASRDIPASVHTHRVGVRPEDQGRGIGRLLFDAFLRSLEAERIRTTTLFVSEANAAATRFYRSLGYEPAGTDPTELVATTPEGLHGGRSAQTIEREDLVLFLLRIGDRP